MARVTKINVGGTNYDIAHEGELKNSGFEVVNQLPTDNLFTGRQVFENNRNLQPYIWNGHDWITNYKTYQIVSAASISQQGWYDIGYYTDTTTQGSNAFLSTEFHGTLRIITGYNLDRPLSLVLSISGGFSQLCMTQLSSCIGKGIIPKIRVVYNSELKRRILQFYYSANKRNSVSIDYTDNSYYHPVFFMPLYAKSDVNYEGDAIIKEFTLTNGVKTNYNVEGASIIKTGGTATQMLMADGSTKDISEFATVATSGSYNDLTDKPTLATVATSGSYNDLTDKPTFSGSYNDLTDKPTLFSGSYDDLTNKPTLATVATSGSYNDLTNTPNLATVATSGSYNDLTDKPAFSGSYNDLTDKPTLFSGSYEDLTNKPTLATVATSGSYNDLIDKPTFSGSYNDLTDKPNLATVATSGSYDDLLNKPDLVFSNIGGNIAPAQITDRSITNDKLVYSSMTLNGITVNLGNIVNLPCFISYSGTLFQARIENNWLQIYRNGIWANLYYLLSSLPTECRYITDLSDPSWFDESVTEYELDNSATEQLLRADGSTNIANWIEAINAQQITFNSSLILSKDFSKGALDNIISNLKGKGYSVFVENDIDTILQSGNDWVMSIKIKRFYNLYKAIIECYVAR